MVRFADTVADSEKVVSALAFVEVRSAITRLRRGDFLTQSEAALATESFVESMQLVIEQPVNPQVIEAAIGVIERWRVRTLDAVQLGSAIVARDLLAAPRMRFVASDKALLEAAAAEGFEVWDPAG